VTEAPASSFPDEPFIVLDLVSFKDDAAEVGVQVRFQIGGDERLPILGAGVSRGQASKRKTASILRPRLFSGVLFVQISTNQFPNKSQNQTSNHKHSYSQFGFWNLKIGSYLEIGSWKFPSLGP
jgi:hypothetical protein